MKNITSRNKYLLKRIAECQNGQSAHSILLREISDYYRNGVKYNDIISNEMLSLARNRVASFDDSVTNYPHIKRLTDFVFTRDIAFTPFGSWIEFDYLDPLAILHFVKAKAAATMIHKSVDILNLASVLYAIKIYQQPPYEHSITHVIKKYDDKVSNHELIYPYEKLRATIVELKLVTDDKILVFIPSTRFRILANVKADDTIHSYLNMLDVHYKYVDEKAYDNSGASQFNKSMIVFGYQQILKELEKYSTQFKRQIRVKYNKLIAPTVSGINLTVSKELNRRIYNYRFNTINNSPKYLNLPEMEGNPLIRLAQTKYSIKYYTQLEFCSIPFLAYSLYFKDGIKGELRSPFTKSDIPLNKVNAKIYSFVLEKLHKGNTFNKIRPLSSPRLSTTEKGLHFDQITKSMEIISRISNTGIQINLERAKQLLSELEYELRLLDGGMITNELILPTKRYIFIADDDDSAGTYDKATNRKDQLKHSIGLLRKMIDAAESIRNKTTGRIYGLFIPHGAHTHRMTCINLPLHTIPRIFRKELYTSKKGFALISADVSGQDIVVTTALAKKFYSNPPRELGLTEAKKSSLLSKIETTITRLSFKTLKNKPAMLAKPIDKMNMNLLGVRDSILAKSFGITVRAEKLELLPHQKPIDLETKTAEEIRDMIKSSVYTKFYGGGVEAIKSNYWPQLNYLVSQYSELPGDLHFESIPDIDATLQKFLYELRGMESYNKLHPAAIHDRIKKILADTETLEIDYKAAIYVFNKVNELMKKSYPGLFELFSYFHKYYQETGYTYPTLLGWQTVLEDEDLIFTEHKEQNYRVSKIATRSMSYPIQASGGEFIREWLIQLSLLKGYQKTFRMVNVLHDQVDLEVKTESIDRLREELVLTSKLAAQKLGINPETLHIKVS